MENYQDLRDLFEKMPLGDWMALARDHELDYWQKTNKFCGRCGTALERHPDPNERAMCCPKCGMRYYPQITPAVIVLVKKGDKIGCSTKSGTDMTDLRVGLPLDVA